MELPFSRVKPKSPPNIVSTFPGVKYWTIGLEEGIINFGLESGFPLHTFAFEGKYFLFK